MELNGSDLTDLVHAVRFTRDARERFLLTIDEDHDEWPDAQEDVLRLRDLEDKLLDMYRSKYGSEVEL